MSVEVLRDARIRSVAWRDLTGLSRREVAKELLLPLPWLALSLWLASRRMYVPALAASFVFYLAGLRQVHNVFHGTIGLPNWASDGVMFLLSILMLGSMHAVRFNHMRHHKHCMDDDDVEAMGAKMGALRAIVTGPLFPLLMHAKALKLASRTQRRRIMLELGANAAWVVLVFGVWNVPALQYHVAAMAIGQCLSSFFCVWTVHHGCDPSETLARTLRGRWTSLATFSMFYHEEHHLFPQVPTCHLGRLAARIDAATPEMARKTVF